MGSFHTTCNISQLPITPGTPVRVLFLQRNQWSMDPTTEDALGQGNNSREGCYSTDWWRPWNAPLRAVYDDYGRVAQVEQGLGLEMFWAFLRANLYEVQAGSNEYHQPASYKEMDWDHMWWVAAEGRLRLKRSSNNHKAVPVCAVMIREDVWKAMLALSSGTQIYLEENNNLVHTSIAFYMEQLKNYLKTMIESNSDDFFRTYAARENIRDIFGCRDRLGDSWSARLEFIVNQMKPGNITLEDPDLVSLLQAIAELQHVKDLYETLRRTWHPGSGMGSQSTNYIQSAHFHHAMAMVGYRMADHELSCCLADEGGDPSQSRTEPRLDDNFINSLQLPKLEY